MHSYIIEFGREMLSASVQLFSTCVLGWLVCEWPISVLLSQLAVICLFIQTSLYWQHVIFSVCKFRCLLSHSNV